MRYQDNLFFPDIELHLDSDSIFTIVKSSVINVTSNSDLLEKNYAKGDAKSLYKIYIKRSIFGYANGAANIPYIFSNRKDVGRFLSSILFSKNIDNIRKQTKQNNIPIDSIGTLNLTQETVRDADRIVTITLGELENCLSIDKLPPEPPVKPFEAYPKDYSEYAAKQLNIDEKIFKKYNANNSKYFFLSKDKDILCMQLLAHILWGDDIDMEQIPDYTRQITNANTLPKLEI